MRIKVLVWGLMLLGVMMECGCEKPPEGDSSAESFNYNPNQDKLVNPAGLFEEPGGPGGGGVDMSQIDTGAMLQLQLEGNPNTLHPFYVSSVNEFVIVNALYAGLFVYDKDIRRQVNDDIVESYRRSEDHTEYIIKLKKGLTWQDGAAFTAADVAYSWEQIMDEQVPCYTQKPSTEPITACMALDEYTVKLVQPQPRATAGHNLVFPVIPKHIFEKDKNDHPDLRSGAYYKQQSRTPVGNGPYKLVEWKDHDKIVLERWEDYAGEKPYFKRIVFRIVADKNMALLLFEKGQLDVVERLSPLQFARATQRNSFRDIGNKGWRVGRPYVYIGWNMDGSNPFFVDQQVRRAMTQAMNVPLILDKVFYNLAGPCTGIYHPEMETSNPLVKQLEYDLEQAGRLLDEAGWPVHDKDGRRYKQGNRKTPFRFTLLIPNNLSGGAQIGAILQEDLRKIGIEMDIHVMEWLTYVEKLRGHEYEAALGGWEPGVDPDWEYMVWHSSGCDGGRNYGGYNNQQVDELLDKGRLEFDELRRQEIYQQIHQLTYEDQPYSWICHLPILAAFNKRTQGVQFSGRGIYGFYPSFYRWWSVKKD